MNIAIGPVGAAPAPKKADPNAGWNMASNMGSSMMNNMGMGGVAHNMGNMMHMGSDMMGNMNSFFLVV